EFAIHNDGWGRIVRQGRQDVYFAETLESVLKTPSDLDKLVFEPASLDRRYVGFSTEVDREKKAGRCVFAKVGGIYARSSFIRGEEILLMDMALDQTFADVLFDRVAEHLTDMALETLRRADCRDNGLFIYGDMANNNTTIFSPAMFERYFLPRYKKLISTCRMAGCKHVFFHSDGNIAPVLDLLLEAGFEGFNPLEPRCGLDLIKLRQKYGQRIIFFGGVCNTRILPHGNKKEIEAHVRPLIELGREGGLILGQASVGNDITPQVYDFYMSLVKQYGRYE
ncbi:MAG: uroporphyrinogen decarboxylase family protein, partial [Verrucomicrobiota bacterium]